MTSVTCYRHPDRETLVRCTRCGNPICPDCMLVAPVGHQCPSCVDAARDEFRRSGAGPVRVGARAAAPATRALLGLILAVFALELFAGGLRRGFSGPSGRSLIDLGALQPFLIADGEVWRLVTAMFLHAGLLHIGFNAYALWSFGQLVEQRFGTPWFVGIYLGAGLVASVASYGLGPANAVGVGASGAIFGVFGAFVAYNYRRRHLVQAAAALRWAMSLILMNTLLAFLIPGIDWRAHVGGAIGGFLLGSAAEGYGEGASRALSRWAIVGATAVAALMLFVTRTADLRSLPIFADAVSFFGS